MTSDATGIDAPRSPPRRSQPANEGEPADAGTCIEAAGNETKVDAMTSGRDCHGSESKVRRPNIDRAAVDPGATLRVVRFVEIYVAGDRCVDIRGDPSVWTILVDDVDRARR